MSVTAIVVPIVVVAAIILIYFTCGRRYFAGGVCKIKRDLTGNVIVITGSNSGLGKETAKQLAKTGATIVLACRSADKTEPVVDEIKTQTGNKNIVFIQLDLGDLKSIEKFAKTFKERYQRLDILINNAGLISLSHAKTKDGFELMMGTNHLGHFHLSNLLLDVIKRSAPARVVNLTGSIHKTAKLNWDDLMFEKTEFSAFQANANSKIANVLFAKGLQKRVGGSDVKVVSLHPGSIATNFGAEEYKKTLAFNILFNWILIPAIRVFGKTMEQGVQTTLYCSLEDQEKLVGGGYYDDCKIAKESAAARDEENIRKMWEISEQLISSKLSKDAY